MKKYVYYHKPTDKWVYLKLNTPSGEFEQYGSFFEIELVDDVMSADWYNDPLVLKEDLQSAKFGNKLNYALDNFLEFILYSIKTQHIIEPCDNL